MEIFGQRPQKVIEEFSREFEATFLEHLRRSHPFSRVAANVVYNEFIQDRDHVHMNATKWLTLTEFIKYLGREGKCKVDETPKGWFITLIQEDPFEAMAKKKKREREKSEKESDERHLKILKAQAERARGSQNGEKEEEKPRELDLNMLKEPVTISIAGSQNGEKVLDQRKEGSIKFDEGNDVGFSFQAGKKSKVEELMEKELKMKKQMNQRGTTQHVNSAQCDNATDGWLLPNIMVKVLSEGLKEHGYYKKKGIVIKVVDKFIGEVEMLDSGDVLRIDQDELETVVPLPGKRVKVVKGEHRGKKGVLESLDKANFGGSLRLEGEEGNVFLEYEYFSKY
jgi:DNA/RNA-binding protein KIN17